MRGAAAGEGLGNRFLAEIRETDAICHVVRAHGDERVPHPEGRVDPVADAEVVEAELLLADLEQAERRLERVRKQAGSGAKEAAAERDWLERVVEALGRGGRCASVPAPDAGRRCPGAPPGAELEAGALRRQRGRGRRASLPPSWSSTRGGTARLHRGQRPDRGGAGGAGRATRRPRCGPSSGSTESGLARLVRAAYELLDLVTFFTAHRGSEARARALRAGPHRLGRRRQGAHRHPGRVRARRGDRLARAGRRRRLRREARERGLIRTEGRDYVVRDGDVITIRH